MGNELQRKSIIQGVLEVNYSFNHFSTSCLYLPNYPRVGNVFFKRRILVKFNVFQ